MILVCGEGLGHTSRCISLGKEMEAAGHDVHFGAYGYSRELIEKKGHTTHTISSEITLIGKAGSLNMKKSILATFRKGQLREVIKLRKLLKRIDPDVIVSDSYYIGLLTAKSRSIPCHLMMNQSNMENFFKGFGISSKIIAEIVKTFYAGVFKLTDGLIIPDYPLPHTVCRKNLELTENSWKKVFFSGPLIGKTFEETDAFELKRPHVLCTVGGFGYREPIFRKVIDAARMDSSINYTLLSGPNVDEDKFDSIPDNVQILSLIEDQFPYLKASDVIIAPGGHSTMMEALSFGIPMISIPDQSHSEQQNNAIVIEEDGLGKKLGYSASPSDILENIRSLTGEEKYKNKLNEMRELAEELNGPVALREMLEEKLQDIEHSV